MAIDLVPSNFWRISDDLRNFWEDSSWRTLVNNTPTGLSISEDEQHIYVEAAVPGINPDDVEVTFDKGMLWIKGESEKQTTNRKVYQTMASNFSYRIAVPGDIDTNVEPEAAYEHGIMTVAFAKLPQAQPKKIMVKSTEKPGKKEEKK